MKMGGKQAGAPPIDLYEMERLCRQEGFQAVCGVDEAGRGPLAGPVCAAAVILNPEDPIFGLNDSKKLSPKRREQLFDEICARALAFSVGWADQEEIDRANILQATFLAMGRAAAGLRLQPDLLLVDGNRNPSISGAPNRCVVKGDGKCAAIAAASILATVSRDRLMETLAVQYPGYGFEIHKGYGTQAHRQAILEKGPCPIHRKTFLKKLWAAQKEGK